ncbi:MAG TPA: LamG-like jellyroll fold domain-containing protein [Burkholderiaceae bacterium]|nr:LamG-like jellyroll fold domain-containing protein [Burkholderiaceae bacterium]
MAEGAAAPSPTPAAPQRQPASVTGVFRHPGLLLTDEDADRIRAHIRAGEQPWAGWWDKLCTDKFGILDTKPYPLPAVYRQDGSKNNLYVDIWRAWSLALRWKLSGDTRYADKAAEFLDAWADTLKEVGTVPPGSTAHDDHTFILMAGMQGQQLAQIGELLRGYPGWAPEKLKRFQDMLMTVFASISSWFLSEGRIGSHANWDMASIVGAMAIGIFCDNAELYRLACDSYAANNRGKLRNFGNGSALHGVYYMHPGHFGQWEESGRDQGHSTLGMSLGGDAMEMAWNQGDDLYGLYNNRFLAAAEYVARSNLLDANGKPYAMPFVPEHNPTQPHPSFWTEVNQSFQHGRNCWEPLYNHYVNRMGLAAPNVARMVPLVEPKYGGSSDDVWWPTLIHRRAPYAGPMKPPSGLTGHLNNGRVLLSWWGSVGATAYAVQRGPSARGPFTTVATVAADQWLTCTDAPPDGIWFYQVLAQGTGAPRKGSNMVRVALPGELRLRMPLDGSTTGQLLNPDGSTTTVEGTLLDGAVWGEGRNKDKAVAFDGKKAGLQLPSGLFRDLDDFTVSLWAYANGLHWDSCILFAGTDAFSALYIAPQTGHGLRFALHGATFNDQRALEAPSFMATKRWVHVAYAQKGTTGRLYLDGVEVASADSMTLTPRQVGDQVIFLGRNWGHPSFNGRLQDFRIYVGALSAAELAALAK